MVIVPSDRTKANYRQKLTFAFWRRSKTFWGIAALRPPKKEPRRGSRRAGSPYHPAFCIRRCFEGVSFDRSGRRAERRRAPAELPRRVHVRFDARHRQSMLIPLELWLLLPVSPASMLGAPRRTRLFWIPKGFFSMTGW